MGQIAAQYCDEVIITDEDPYDENPEQIMKEVALGVLNYKLKTTNYKLIIDRREAIGQALKSAQPGDNVVITGKGCEPSICVSGGKRIPWDDRQAVKEEFEKLKYDTADVAAAITAFQRHFRRGNFRNREFPRDKHLSFGFDFSFDNFYSHPFYLQKRKNGAGQTAEFFGMDI